LEKSRFASLEIFRKGNFAEFYLLEIILNDLKTFLCPKIFIFQLEKAVLHPLEIFRKGNFGVYYPLEIILKE
jgi:hypothetical protein